MSQSKNTKTSIMKLDVFDATVDKLEFGQPAKFKNQSQGRRISVKPPGVPGVEIQLVSKRDDALHCPFGCTMPPEKLRKENEPDKWSVVMEIEAESAQFATLKKLEARVRAQGPTHPDWFAGWDANKKRLAADLMTPIVADPKIDEATGQLKSDKHTLRVTVKPENITVFVDRGVGQAPLQIVQNPHLAITAHCRVIPIIALGYIWITGSGWGVTWFLNSVIVIPGASRKITSVTAFQLDGEDMVEAEKEDVAAPSPANNSMEVDTPAPAVAACSADARPAMPPPLDLESQLFSA